MFKNYLKLAFRNLYKHKVNSLINIFGLSIGLACCILILLYVGEEMSYDSFHQDADGIFRVVLSYQREGVRHFADTPAPLKTALQTDYPELKDICRVGGIYGNRVVVYKHKQLRGQRIQRVDDNFLKMFSFPLIRGSNETALKDVASVVITRQLADTLFGEEDPMGKVIKIGSTFRQTDFLVTGVLKNIPANTRFQVDAITSFRVNYTRGNEGNVSWGALNYSTYIRVPETFNPTRLVSASRQFWQKYRGREIGGNMDLHLQPLSEVHISLSPGYLLPTDRKGGHIYIYLAVALLILIIAAINYMNLTVARYMDREREVGMRKVLGAKRRQLIIQFLGESVVMTLLAMVLALLLAELFLPLFNQYTGKTLSLSAMVQPFFLGGYLILSLCVGIIAGGYPAFYISSLPVFTILKDRTGSRKPGRGLTLKKVLVFLQFTIFLIFLICTAVIHRQMNFIQNRELGYNSEQVIVVPIYQLDVKGKYQLFKTDILSYQGVVSASAANYLPAKRSYFQNIYLEEGDRNKMQYISWIPVDADFIKTMGIKLVTGTNFSRNQTAMAGRGYILNETAVRQLNWDQPLTKRLKIIEWGPVIGVVKDFHFKSLHFPVQPMALCVHPQAFEYLLVRIRKEDTAASIRFLKSQWQRIFPHVHFTYTFFDDHFQQVYQSEARLGDTFNLISGLAVMIACLGLFALFSFTTGQRAREISIRKVLGCSAPGIVVMLTKELVYAVLLASVVAWPITHLIMNKWLQNFAFKTDIGFLLLLICTLFCLGLALTTVGFKAMKHATTNPADTMRYE